VTAVYNIRENSKICNNLYREYYKFWEEYIMPLKYNVSDNDKAKLGSEYLDQHMMNPDLTFGDWLLNKLHYACSVTRDGFEIEIVFKEEKDLTFFLMTL